MVAGMSRRTEGDLGYVLRRHAEWKLKKLPTGVCRDYGALSFNYWFLFRTENGGLRLLYLAA